MMPASRSKNRARGTINNHLHAAERLIDNPSQHSTALKPARKSKTLALSSAIARYYQSLLDSGQFANRAALARYRGVSRSRVTQVLRRVKPSSSQDGY